MNMSEFPSPFCPKDCLFNGVPKMCDTDCQHSKDQVFVNPEEVEVKTGDGWKKAKIVGRTGDKLYIEMGRERFTMSVRSPLIR